MEDSTLRTFQVVLSPIPTAQNDTKEGRGTESARKRDKREEGGETTADGDRKGDRRTGGGG
jgi:hypothetical protein